MPTLFGGGDDARQLENPIAADLDAMRPSVLPSLLAAAQRNQARGFNELMLFEIGAQFESGMPEAQTNVAAGIRVGERRAQLDASRPTPPTRSTPRPTCWPCSKPRWARR